jgi:hypothetical protein
MSRTNRRRYTPRKHAKAIQKSEKNQTPKPSRHPDRSAPPPLPPPGAAAEAMKKLVDNGVLTREWPLAPSLAIRLEKATRRGR